MLAAKKVMNMHGRIIIAPFAFTWSCHLKYISASSAKIFTDFGLIRGKRVTQ